MVVDNPLQMNNWEIKKFLRVIIALQFAIWGVVGLDYIGLHIPIIRQIIGFVYLVFLPGVVLIRILRLHNLSNIEMLLCSVGLSLSTLMFTGFFMNLLYPLIGLEKPISLFSLVVIISIIMLSMCVICYVRDKDFAEYCYIDIKDLLKPQWQLLCTLPLMAVIGTYLVNYYKQNILLLIMIILIAIFTILICFNKFFSTNIYSFAIFIFAISLIYHHTLISKYLLIHDVYMEYHVAKLVVNNSYWNLNLPNQNNAMLSNIMLAPIFYHICNLNLTYVFKLFYPLIFSLMPVGLFNLYKNYMTDKMAFLSCFLVILINPFYTIVASTTKQSTAEFYLVLLIIVLLKKGVDKITKSLLSIIFSVSIIVSHYGTSYLVMFSFIFNALFLTYFNKVGYNFFRKYNMQRNNSVTLSFILIYVVFAFMWYIYVSNSETFNIIVRMGNHIVDTVFNDFLNPKYSRGMFAISETPPSHLYFVYKLFHLAIQLFIMIGLFRTVFSKKESQFEKEYIGFSLSFFIILISAIVIPKFAAMHPSRLYQLALLFLAPFSIIGFMTIIEFLNKYISNLLKIWNLKHAIPLLYIIFTIYYLFNIGFLFEILNDHPRSVSISQNKIKKYGNIEERGSLYRTIMTEQDVFSSKWLSKNMNYNKNIYATYGWGDGAAVLHSYGLIPEKNVSIRYMLNDKTKNIEKGSYIYLLYVNVIEGIRFDNDPNLGRPLYFHMNDVYPIIKEKNKIYTNGGSEILWN